MPTISITCPNCSKVLRPSARPPEGKKVKCPACGNAFLPEVNDAEGIQEESKTKVKAASNGKAENSSSKKSRDPDEEKNTPSIKKKKKEGKKSNLMLLIAGGVGVLGCVGCVGCGGLAAVGLFVWPGWLVGGPSPGDFVPQRANLVIGVNTKFLRDKKQLDTIVSSFEKFAKDDSKDAKKMPPEFLELLKNSDQLLLCVDMTPPKGGKGEKNETPTVMIIQASSGAVKKFKDSKALGTEQKMGDKHKVYRPNEKEVDLPRIVSIPSDSLVLLSGLSDAEHGALLERSQKSAKDRAASQSPALAWSKAVEKSPVWAAWVFDEETRKNMRKDAEFAAKIPEMKKMSEASKAMADAKGFNLQSELVSDTSWKLKLTAECLDEPGAKALVEGAKAQKDMMLGFMKLAAELGKGKADAAFPPTLIPDLETLAFENQGATMTARMQLSTQTIAEVHKLGGKKEKMK